MVGEKKSKAATFIIASRLECQRPSTDGNFAENFDWDVAEKYFYATLTLIVNRSNGEW